jgi:serine O-acetyltransferase
MNAIALYRVGNWLHRHRIPILPKLLHYLTFLVFNSAIPPSCQIGKGSRFAYGGIGVVLHAKCQIGNHTLIGQNITIGGTFGSDVPTVGHNVFIGPGVRILGGIRVGNNVVLGANAVVLKDVPDNCIAAGVPARVLRTIPEGLLDALTGTFRNLPEVSATNGRDSVQCVEDLSMIS